VNSLESIDDYEVIYVWWPIYRWQLPQPMVTQLEKLNWKWKIVRPFTTLLMFINYVFVQILQLKENY
jgi:hypothetical protein